MNEIWELDWISDEEYGCVVSNHIVISFFGIELDGPSSWISVAVISSTLSGDSRETKEAWSSLTNTIQEICSREPKKII